jgi:predicted hydrocarbon binding protein
MKFESVNAQELLKEYISKMELDDELRISNLPMVIVSKDIFFTFWREMTRIVGAPAATIMYFAGETSGKELYGDMKKGADSREELITALCDNLLATGIGKIEIEISDDEKSIEIVAKNGLPIGKRAEGKVADSYFTGCFAGFFSELFNKKFGGTEEECVAKGDNRCRIVLREEVK